MRTFEYKGYQATGKGCGGLIEALDLKDAREKLAQQGILVERLAKPGRRAWGRRALSGRQTFPVATRCMVYTELASLLKSGLAFTQALDVLIATPELGDSRAVLAAVRDQVRDGSSPAEALAASSARVSSFERAVLIAGEETGGLDAAAEQLAHFLEEEESIRQSVRTALIYPTLVAALAVGLVILMQTVMLPGLSRILTEARVELPALTRFMLSLHRVGLVLGLPLIGLMVGLAAWIRSRWRNDPGFRIRMDALLFRMPLWRGSYGALVNLRFSRTLGLLLKGGVPVVDGVAMAGRATGSPWVEHLVLGEAEGLRHGRSLADVLRGIPPLSGSLPGWVEVGEMGGGLQDMLAGASERYRKQWARQVGRFLALLEPALLLAVGAFVLLVALAVLLPVLSMNSQL